MKINSNITALMTMTHMNKANNQASTAVNRLSSGYKINTVSDSPAGWAISKKIEGQANGLSQANRNSMDAISLLQTTEGALNEINAMLNRIRDLCVEAVNDTNTGNDRKNMQDEINQLVAEINSITERTDFNGIKMLNNKQNITIQTGANAYEMLELSGESTSMSSVLSTLVDFNVMKVKDYPEIETVINRERKVNEMDIDYIQLLLDNKKIDNNGNEISNNPLLSNSAIKNQIHAYIHPGLETVEDKPILITPEDPEIIELIISIEEEIWPRNIEKVKNELKNREGIDKDLTVTDNTITAEMLANELKDKGITNLTITISSDNKGNRKVNVTSNKDDTLIKNNIQDLVNQYTNNRFNKVVNEIAEIKEGYKENDDPLSKALVKDVEGILNRVGDTGDNAIIDIDTFLDEISKVMSKTEVNELDVLENAINKIDKCITKVTDIRSRLGAYQNRLEAIVSNLGVSEENTIESLSRIRDTDMAEEITEYTLKNVVAQAGISMLAQANQRPQQILQLLAQ